MYLNHLRTTTHGLIAPRDKFNYLNSILVKSDSEAISGLSCTAANYDEVVAVLKRFGNKQLIIGRQLQARERAVGAMGKK